MNAVASSKGFDQEDCMRLNIREVVIKNTVLYRSSKYVQRKLRALMRVSYFFVDPLGIRGKWYKIIKGLQLDRARPLFLDRQREVQDYFGVSDVYLCEYYLRHGLPWSDRFKRNYLQAFEGNTQPESLKRAYDSIPLDYTLRLMMTYERFSLITGYLDFLEKDSGKALDEYHVLDYGCGVSDIGLLFSSFGAKVTICDLDNSRFDFVVERFHRRGYAPTEIRVTGTEQYPELPPEEYDLIVATELFEHVRDPLRLLRNFTGALRRGGYLFDSMGGVFERDDRPHHLVEAFKIGRSEEYADLYARSYEHMAPGEGLTFLFKRK